MVAALARNGGGTGIAGKLALALGAAYLAAVSYLAMKQAVTPDRGAPEAALSVAALERLSPGELADAEQAARAAFAHDPLDATAILDLSHVAQVRGQDEAAQRLKLVAGDMTPRATRIQAEALSILLARRDFDAALSRLDGLIRAKPSDAANFFALAAEISADPEGVAAVARMLATNPPWRRQFFDALIAKGQAETAFGVMGAMRSTDAAVDVAETRALIDAELRAGDIDRAYTIWLAGLGEDELKDVRLVYDGGFTHPPRSLRFDWTVAPSEGLAVRLFPRNTASMDQTLQIDLLDFQGGFANLSQILRLRPGRYQLSGEVRFENFASPTGLVFRLLCLDRGKGKSLDETAPLPQSTQWIGFEKTFRVPDAGCTSQLLRLESRSGLDKTQLTRGMVAVDAVKIDSLPPLAP